MKDNKTTGRIIVDSRKDSNKSSCSCCGGKKSESKISVGTFNTSGGSQTSIYLCGDCVRALYEMLEISFDNIITHEVEHENEEE